MAADSLLEPKMDIEIWSDIMCPFCYIGKRNLETAMSNLAFKDQISIQWRSFQLDPALEPTANQNIYQYLADRKGIRYTDSLEMHRQVTIMAAASGLDYHFEKMIVANSFQAHRLLQLAKTLDLGSEAEEALFKAYFVQGIDLGQVRELIRIAQQIGIEKETAVAAFQSPVVTAKGYKEDKLSQMITADIQMAEKLSVNAVPYFLLDGQRSVKGAQPVTYFQQVLQQNFLRWQQKNQRQNEDKETSSGVAPYCGPENDC